MVLDKVKYCIHIGYPKTGTSYLQKYFFPYQDICYVKMKEALNEIVFKSDMEFNPEPLKKRLSESDKTILVSRESLCGNLLGRRIEPKIIAERLYQVFGEDTGIIMVIRNTKDIVWSIYKQFLRHGTTLTLEQLLDPYSIYGIDMSYFNYEKVADVYRKFFKVKLIPYGESMEQEICDFLSIKLNPVKKVIHNKSFPDWLVPIVRFLNRFVKSQFNPNGIPFPLRRIIDSRIWRT